MKNYFLFILLSLFFSQNNYAQLSRTKNTYVVNINADGQTIRAEVFEEKVKIKPNEKRSYFWFASNKIVETKGGYDGKLLHGQYSAFYLASNLKEKGEFKYGLKNNRWTLWYENGNIKEITTWKNGQKSGVSKTFKESGEQTYEAIFKNGRLNGFVTKFQEGKIVSRQKYKDDQEVIEKEKTVVKKPKETGIPKENKSVQDTSLMRKAAEKKLLDKKETEKNKLAKELELKKKSEKKKIEEEETRKKQKTSQQLPPNVPFNGQTK